MLNRHYDGNNWPGWSALYATGHGKILANQLASMSNVDMYHDSFGTIDAPDLTSATACTFTFTGGSQDLALTDAPGSTFNITGANVTAPDLANIDGASFFISGGSSLSLPDVYRCGPNAIRSRMRRLTSSRRPDLRH